MYGLGTYDLLDWCQHQSHTFGDVMGEERVKAQVSRWCHLSHNSVECNTYNNKYTPSSIARAWAINSAIRSPS